MKHVADVITLLRVVFALGMLLTAPFSALFWVCYALCGLSDAADGFAARRLNQVSARGAKLDSMADAAAIAIIAVVAVKNLSFPAWMWALAGCVAAVRLIGYAVGYKKYRTFSALHTNANKAAGALLFLFPVLYRLCGSLAAGILVGGVAAVSALEELIITLRSQTLDRDVKGVFKHPQPVKHGGQRADNGRERII